MARTADKPAPSRMETVDLRNATDARVLRPLDYAIPPLAEFEAKLMGRLGRMIAAGATDAETLGALDGAILAREASGHHNLDLQREDHIRTCADIVDLAQANLRDAEQLRAGTAEKLEVAATLRMQLQEKLVRQDPDLTQYA